MREKRCLPRRYVGRVLRTTENTRRHDTFDNRGQSRPSPDNDPGPLARGDAPDVGVPADAGNGEDIHSYVADGNQRRVQG